MEEKQSRNSCFVSWPGLFCLLFFAVMANYFKAWMISAFLFLVFLMCLSSYVWSRGICRHVELFAEGIDTCCHAGERCFLNLRVKNKSLFPLVWLDVILPTGEKPLVKPAEAEEFSWYFLKNQEKAQTGVRERFVWLLWQQEIVWQEELLTVKRGAVTIEGAGLQAGDGFGLSAKEDWHPFQKPVRILIYPKLVPISAAPFLKVTQEAVARNKGQTEDITILKSSRPYQPGDPVKRINWRLLAGSGQMTVNVYETVTPGCAAFLLDLDSFKETVERSNGQGGTIREEFVTEKALEQMISLIASCISELAALRMETAFMIPGYGSREPVMILPREGEDVRSECMEALALLDYQAEETWFPYEEFWQSSHKLGNLFLCTRTDGKPAFEELAYQLGRSRVRYLVLKQGTEGMGEFDCIYADSILSAQAGEEDYGDGTVS